MLLPINSKYVHWIQFTVILDENPLLVRDTMLYNSTKCDQQEKRYTIVH